MMYYLQYQDCAMVMFIDLKYYTYINIRMNQQFRRHKIIKRTLNQIDNNDIKMYI